MCIRDRSHGQPVPGKGPLVCRDERPLPHAGRGLLGREVARALRQVKRGDAGRDGPRGDQDDRGPGVASGGKDVHERLESGHIESPTGRQRARADLDDQSHGVRDGRPVRHALILVASTPRPWPASSGC